MPSLLATDAVPFNEGWYDENKVEEEGLLPLPSITSKRGLKNSLVDEKEEGEGVLSRRKSKNISLDGDLQVEQRNDAKEFSSTNNFLGEHGLVVGSAEWLGLNSEELHKHSVEHLQTCKDPSKIFYFGNLECRQNMEDTISFFEKFNEGNYVEVPFENEEIVDVGMEGIMEEKERIIIKNGEDMEGFQGKCTMHVDVNSAERERVEEPLAAHVILEDGNFQNGIGDKKEGGVCVHARHVTTMPSSQNDISVEALIKESGPPSFLNFGSQEMVGSLNECSHMPLFISSHNGELLNEGPRENQHLNHSGHATKSVGPRVSSSKFSSGIFEKSSFLSGPTTLIHSGEAMVVDYHETPKNGDHHVNGVTSCDSGPILTQVGPSKIQENRTQAMGADSQAGHRILSNTP
ncbi:hypothetical protein L6452_16045 [Arctium lappa]|uniref:Uncharacterized protein n=1 Tax=Arctium lappa TaxID=4217 RepID=A0ACB9CQQ0_ARCLA|nr:hypothetical protein L6452_16045 [Arctium lappa]